MFKSHLVHIVIDFGKFFFKTFSFSNGKNDFSSFLIFVRKTFNKTPVVKDILWESFSLGISSKGSSETKRFRDRKISFNLELNNNLLNLKEYQQFGFIR